MSKSSQSLIANHLLTPVIIINVEKPRNGQKLVAVTRFRHLHQL